MRYRLNGFTWILVATVVGPQLYGCEPDPAELGRTEYQKSAGSFDCKPGFRTGKAGITNDEITPNGVKFNVRTPSNYDASFPHPLIVVYAPAGKSRFSNERMTNLTLAATRAGFIIAYPNHKRMSGKALIEFAGIPDQISGKWCVDDNRIFLTGHSDGGTVAMGLAFLEDTRHIPDAIAPSAAGIRGSDLAAYPCPEPISVLIMHSKLDRLFPEFGNEAAQWWAACNQCDNKPRPMKVAGCLEYPDCNLEVKTWYCEGKAPHGEWPDLNSTVIDFFTSHGARRQAGLNSEGAIKDSL